VTDRLRRPRQVADVDEPAADGAAHEAAGLAGGLRLDHLADDLAALRSLAFKHG